MRRYFFFLIFTFYFFFRNTCADHRKCRRLHDGDANAQVEMDQKYMAYISASAHSRRAKKIEKLRTQALESIDNAKYKTMALPKYKGDNSLGRQASTISSSATAFSMKIIRKL